MRVVCSDIAILVLCGQNLHTRASEPTEVAAIRIRIEEYRTSGNTSCPASPLYVFDVQHRNSVLRCTVSYRLYVWKHGKGGDLEPSQVQ